MSTYLYHLVAKNFNLLNTVQPHLPSVFEPLPESALLFEEAGNWEPSTVTVEETEPETTLQAEKFTFDIEQLLERQYAITQPVQRTQGQAPDLSPATNLQIPDETTNPLSTDLTSTPAQHSQAISASTPYLAEESTSEQSPAQAFLESVVSETTTDNMPLTQNTELKTSTALPISAVKLQAQSCTQQPKQSTDPVVSSRQSLGMESWELFPTQPLLESEIISPPTAQVAATPNTEPLTPALVLETKTPLSSRVVEQPLTSAIASDTNASLSNPIYEQKTLTPKFLPQQPIANHVVSSFQSSLKPDLQLFSISKLTEPAVIPVPHQQRTFFLQSPDTTMLTTAIAKENNAALANFAVEQWGELTTQFSHNQSIGLNREVSAKLLPEEKPVTEISHKQPIEINRFDTYSQLPQVESSELPSPQPQAEPAEISPLSYQVLPIVNKKLFTPALTVENNTSSSSPTITQQQQPLVELQELRLDKTPVVSSSSPSQKPSATEISPIQPQPQPAEISPLSHQVLPIVNKKLFTPALTVENNTSSSSPTITQQQQPLVELQELRLDKTPVVSSSSPSQKLISTEISQTQPQAESVAIEQSAGSSRAIAQSPAPSRAIASIIDRMSPNPHTQSLTPAIAIQTHVTLPHSIAEPQGKLASDVPGIQRKFAHQGVSSTQPPLTDVSPEPFSLETKSPTALAVDDVPSSVISQQPTQLNAHSQRTPTPTPELLPSTAVASVQPQISFSDSNLSDFFKREQATLNREQGVLVGDLNPNQNLRRLKVRVSDSPTGNDEGIVSSRVDNLVLPQNPTPNPSTYAGRENGNGVRSLYFKHLDESDIRPLAQPINDITEKSLSVIAASSKEAQQRSPEDLETPPVVQVTIGRVEIRATPPPAPPPSRPKPRPAASVMSLDEYLRRRAQRR